VPTERAASERKKMAAVVAACGRLLLFMECRFGWLYLLCSVPLSSNVY
jgi:hypothetical protein